MPTVVKAEDRKLTYRRRIRLNKAEEIALDAFFKVLEDNARRGLGPRNLKKSFELAECGVKYLGAGCYKVAFALPGRRFVVKVPCGKDFARDLKSAAIEAAMYDRASVELRENLANTRVSPKPYATLQEMAPRTVQAIIDGDGTTEERQTINSRFQEFRMMLRSTFGLAGNDLHQGNIAVRADGSFCVIDFALEQI